MQTLDSIRRSTELNPILRLQGITQEDLLPAQTSSAQEENVSFVEGPSVVQKVQNLENSKHQLNARVDALQKNLESTQEALRNALSRLDGAESKLRALRFQGAEQTTTIAQKQQQPTQVTTSVQEPAPIPEEPAKKSSKTDPSVSIESIFYCGAR